MRRDGNAEIRLRALKKPAENKAFHFLITHIAQPDLERYTVRIYSDKEKPYGQESGSVSERL